MFDGKRLWAVRLTVDRPTTKVDGQTTIFRANVNLGVLATDCEAAIAAAKSMVADKHPVVWAVNHLHQVDCEE